VALKNVIISIVAQKLRNRFQCCLVIINTFILLQVYVDTVCDVTVRRYFLLMAFPDAHFTV